MSILIRVLLIAQLKKKLITKGIECINEDFPQGGFYIIKNISIKECSFSRQMVYNGHGGIIYAYGKYFIDVSECLFRTIACSYSGGAIYTSGDQCNSTIVNSRFLKCSAIQGGGALSLRGSNYIYYLIFYNCSSRNEYGGAVLAECINIYLRMICAHRCSSGDYTNYYGGHFLYIKPQR